MYSYLKVCSNVFVLGGNTEFSSSFLLGLCLLNPEGFNKRQHHLPALDSGSTIPLSCFSVLSSCLENRISGPFPSLCHGFIHVSPKSSSLRQHLHMPFRGAYRHSYTKINWLSIWNADVTGCPYPHLLNLAACARMSWRSFWHTVEGTATALLISGAQNGCGHHNWMQKWCLVAWASLPCVFGSASLWCSWGAALSQILYNNSSGVKVLIQGHSFLAYVTPLPKASLGKAKPYLAQSLSYPQCPVWSQHMESTQQYLLSVCLNVRLLEASFSSKTNL